MTTPARDTGVIDASTAADPLVRLRQVAITHEGETRAAPASVSFDVQPGDVVLLLGPSGSGKSTLTLALNGLIPHAIPATISGTVSIAGLDATTTPVSVLSTRVGMVFQDPDAQLVTGTVLDEVCFGPENLRLPVAEVLSRAEAALRRVGLWDRRGENPDRLSGGGRQRLAIACALALGSPLLVLDEPTANLDPSGIDDVYAALADIAADRERALLLVEHNLDAAIDIVTRVVVLDADGTVAADGGVDEILRERASELHALGVWLPTSALAGLRLRSAGYTLEPLPLSPAELHAQLAATPPLARVVDPSGIPERSGAGDGAERPLAVSVRGLTLRRGKAEVLREVSVGIRAGDFVAVVGANGAGKTTLVQAMAGVLRPPRGAVYLGESDLTRLDDRERAARIGFVFQNPEHQFITATVFDELAHGLRRQGVADADIQRRVSDMLERFGLGDRAGVHPFLLSGGQKRRLSVGTALVGGAPVLALDEPTFGQDRARAEELLGLLSELNSSGTTIIVVTHDMQLVAEHADRVIVLDQGRVAASDTARAVLADAELLTRAGLRPPPLARALAELPQHPELAGISRVADLPGGVP